jgi:DeoR/GlpR family transcriptional regulator of sugar metabolism
MPIPVTQALLEESSKRKLTTKERRQCVVYLKTTNVEITNTELAEMFQVTERTIRQDLQDFRKQKARFIKEDDVGLIIADIALDYERQIKDIERSKAKAKIGSLVYLQHCTNAMDLRLKCVKALQDLGYYPKNLGNMTIKKFDFKALVNQLDGSVSVVKREDIQDAELIEPMELTDGGD